MADLDSFGVFLSASVPRHLVGTNKAQSMLDLLVVLAGGILANSGVLVFGGHPTITPLIHRVANIIGTSEPLIRLFQLNRFRAFAPEEVYDDKVFQNIKWFGSYENDRHSLVEELTQMRNAMMKASHAGIFIGGKTEKFSGKKPGIRDEYEIFLEQHPKGPVYLVGMLEGETLNIINHNNESSRKTRLNSLQEEEINILQSSNNTDLIASIILKDLKRHLEQQ